MRYPYDDPSVPYPPEGDQTPINSQPIVQEAPVYPHGFQQKPPGPPPSNGRSSGGLRTGAIIVLTLVLAIVFGTGLFAGWEYSRGTTSTPSANGSSTGVLEPGTSPTTTVPALTGNNIEAVREAVIAKVRAVVEEVKVTASGGGGIGSGVIMTGAAI